MDLQEVQRLALQGEGLKVEFKRKVDYPDKVAREVVAFANAEGGTLLIGVDDDGTLSGLKNPEGELFAIRNAIEQFIRPVLKYKNFTIPLNRKKSIVCIEIPKGRKKPYSIEQEEGGRRQVYFRVEDKSIKASKELKEIIRGRNYRKNIHITYGEEEKFLMEYLETNKLITCEEFEQKAKISRKKASEILIKLTLVEILEINPSEGKDLFFEKIN